MSDKEVSEIRWRQVEEIFDRALALAAEARPAFLAEACGADVALRREVNSLLAYEKEAGRTFFGPAPELPDESAAARSHSAGDRFGEYEITGFIGAGGMGEVYRAYEPRLRRQIALKVLPVEVNQDSLRRRRFEQEAHAVAALTHPYIAAIYGLEELDGVYAIAMELVKGTTLAERIARGPIPIQESLAIASQIAEALDYAHQKGIVHHDLKPANMMLTSEGHIKLLDFGLARRVALQAPGSDLSETGVDTGEDKITGTIGYMSPEQVRGLSADTRSDLFSFGVVLHEMITGDRPFKGGSPLVVCHAILHSPPCDLGASPTPGKLRAIVLKLLEKDPAKRFRSAGEAHRELRALERALPLARPAKLAWTAGWAAIILTVLLAGWLWHRWSRERWVHGTAEPEITRLVDAGQYGKAAALAKEARAVRPKDPAIEKLWLRATGEVSFATDPPEADVSIRPYQGDRNAWTFLGKTPLKKVRVALGDYVWRIAKPGFAGVLIIGSPPDAPPPGYHKGFSLNLKLRPEGSVPPDMVVVAGGRVGIEYPYGAGGPLQLPGFLIDRHEVTNEEYKKFVDAGAYRRRELWKQPLVRDRRNVPWEEAIALFHDATGRPGPATWEMGGYPKGREKHPVAGVSWYEAAAYAEFVGRSLPTAYHWTLAAQLDRFTHLIVPGSNFGSQGTQPVGREEALSGSGTTDMAGNVKEWCWNEAREGKRFILGGGFGEPNYMFHHSDAQSPWDRLANFGFRCVKLDLPPDPAAASRIEVTIRDFSKETPVSDDIFKAYKALYAYDKGQLHAQVEETVSTESWTREKVTFDAAYGHERVTMFLYLPKNASPPFQTVVYFPGAFSFLDDELDLKGLEETRAFLVKAGRAMIAPIYKGMYQRRDGLSPGGKPPAFFRDHVIAWAKDLGRSIDYLETRREIDATKLGYLGDSLGGTEGALLPAVEKRIKVVIVSSGGFQLRHDLPEVDPFNFAAHVTVPVLMVSGRYDSALPLDLSKRPFFHFLGASAKDKRQVIYEYGHGAFPRPDAVRECLDWLDKYLGPVRH